MCKRSLCDSANTALQFGKPLGALKKLFKNGAFPASTYDTSGGFYRAKFWTFSHSVSSHKLYTMYGSGATYLNITMLLRSSSILTTEDIDAGFVSGTVGFETNRGISDYGKQRLGGTDAGGNNKVMGQ